MHLGLLITFTLFALAFQQDYKNPSLDEIFVFVDFFGEQPLYTGIGSADFPITTESNLAKAYFNQGIALLHAFSPFEALRAFRHVIFLDSNCSMGYYGIYKALQWDHGYIRGRNESLALANSLAANATNREQLYIRSENGNFAWFNQTFQQIFASYPGDLQAQIFWAWNVIDASVTIFGYPRPMRAQAQELLNTLVKQYPDNAAIHHYITHAWEDTFYPQNATNSSIVLETLTPSAPHVNHMPGHIYYMIGDNNKAHTVFLNSYSADLAYMNQYNIGFENNWEFIHNLAFMVANLAESGRYSESISWALELQSLEQKHPQEQVLDFNPDTSRSAARFFLQGLCSLPFVYIRFSDWGSADAVLYLTISKFNDLFNGTNTYLLDYFQALRVWTQGMNYVKSKDFNSALNCSVQLSGYIAQLNSTMAESVAYDYSVVARSYYALKVQYAELVALTVNNGNYNATIAALQNAIILEDNIPYNEPTAYPRPVLTSLAETYIAYAEADPNRASELLNEAINAYNQIADNPLHYNSGFALFGIGYCYQLMGDIQGATNAYNSFMAAWPDADDSLPQVKIANTYLQVATNGSTAPVSDRDIYFYSTIVLAALLLVVIVVTVIVLIARRRRASYTSVKS